MLKRGDKLSASKLNSISVDASKSIITTGKIIYPFKEGLNTYIRTATPAAVGGSAVIKYVAKLPPISGVWKKPKYVFWCSEDTWAAKFPDSTETGTGDDQVWAWYPNASYYVPLQKYSYLSGVPEYL